MFSHIGQRVRREVAPRGRNMNIILAINQEMSLMHLQLGQFIVTRNVFQNFIMEPVNQGSELFPGEGHIHMVYDGAPPHLNTVPEPHEERFTLRMLPPYSSIFKSC